jgi:SP family sugar:H+ symporter-like MFS transporter
MLKLSQLRSKTVAIAAAVGFLGALIVITSVPYLIGAQYANLGTRVGFIFGGLTTIITVVTWLCLPETKDRPLEEIDEMFMKVSILPSRAL